MPGKHVLVVDDESVVRDLIDGILRHLGHLPQVVGTAQEALALMSANEFDVALVDLHMPDLKGDKLAEEIKKLKPGVPVILISGDPPLNLPGSVDGLLRKPFSIGQLREILNAFL